MNPEDLPGGVIETFNDCSESELEAMYRVTGSMKEANLESHFVVSALH